MVSLTPAAGGSARPRNPTNVSSRNASSEALANLARRHGQHAQAARREPVVDSDEGSAPLVIENQGRPGGTSERDRSSGVASTRLLFSRMRRGAPFTNAVSRPSTSRNDAISFRSLENGTTPTTGDASARCARSSPIRSMACSTAASTGSMSGPAVPVRSDAAPPAPWGICRCLLAAGERRRPQHARELRVGNDRLGEQVELAPRRPHPDDRSSRPTSAFSSCPCRRSSSNPASRRPADGGRARAAWPSAACRPRARSSPRPAAPRGPRPRRARCPVSITSPSGAPCRAPRVATAAATPSASHTRRRPSASRRRSSGVRSSWIEPTSVPMRPTSVCAPVAITTARPVPAATVVLLKTRLRRSASGAALFELHVRALGNRQRLARERRFRDPQIHRRDQPRVGRHAVSRGHLDDIARDERLRVDEPQVSLPDDGRARHVEIEQRLHRAAGAPLGQETDERVDDEDRGDGRGFEPIAEEQGETGRRHEQEDDHAGELIAKNRERGSGRRRREPIRSVACQPRGRLRIGQSGSIGPGGGERGVDR